MRVIRGFPAQNIVAGFDEAPGGGDIRDINAPRNRPAQDPASWLSNVYFHTDFFQFTLAFPEQIVTVNHPAVAGATRHLGVSWNGGLISSGGGIGITVVGNATVTNHVLVTHNLGFTPKAFVARDGHMLSTGEMVQLDGVKSRSVSVYADNNIIGLREVAYPTDTAIAGVSRTYTVLIFDNPTADPAEALFSGDADGLKLARAKMRSTRKMLRRTGLGETSYSFNSGRTLDYNNGRVRMVTGGVTVTEPGYGGSFAGSPYIGVGI